MSVAGGSPELAVLPSCVVLFSFTWHILEDGVSGDSEINHTQLQFMKSD
jgi:hypothetical protein